MNQRQYSAETALHPQDTPGMYDEPDYGLAFVLPLSEEEDRIR